jgi:hypothetical protein
MDEILMRELTSPRATTKPPCSRERTWVRWKNLKEEIACGSR